MKQVDGRAVQQLNLLPVAAIGTDPTAANNIADHRFDLTALQWDPAELAKLDVQLHPKPTEPLDLSKLSVAKGLAYVTAFVENLAYREANVTPTERPDMDGFGLPIGVQELRAYKARPLAGVWATSPFLHNGSVPSIYQLLSPQDERATTFDKGTFEYDPKHLAIAPKPLATALCSTLASPAITTADMNFALASAAMASSGACCNRRSAGRCSNT